MKNEIRRELLRRLAHAPEYAAAKYVAELNGDDKQEALRLLSAIGIKPARTYTATAENGKAYLYSADFSDRAPIAAEKDLRTAEN